MENITKTLAELSIILTVIAFVLVVFGLISWKYIFAPIAVALAINVTMYLGRSIYARHRTK